MELWISHKLVEDLYVQDLYTLNMHFHKCKRVPFRIMASNRLFCQEEIAVSSQDIAVVLQSPADSRGSTREESLFPVPWESGTNCM